MIFALAAPGGVLGGVAQSPGVAHQEQGAPATIQVIRRVSVGEVYPAAGGPIGQPQGAGKTRVNSKSSPPAKVPSTAVRSTPVRSTAIRVPLIRTTPGRG
jgi:hypothetical protein